jgi:hypothetical protein
MRTGLYQKRGILILDCSPGVAKLVSEQNRSS